MPTRPPRTRLYVDAPLENGALVPLDGDAAHHAVGVLRLGAGDAVALFNGRDGEWAATIETATRKAATVRAETQTRPQMPESDIRVLFAPLKKTATDYAVEKATEMGVARLSPVITQRTETRRLNAGRLAATARDAAQQSERLSVPVIDDLAPLDAVLADWDPGRTLFVCAEREDAPPLAQAVREHKGPHAFLIGPEGGFQREELDAIMKLPFVVAITLGPRILRAETAIVAALAIWQCTIGDGSGGDAPGTNQT